ncbi:alpha/beta hydrolase family protein [Caulobacter endophyticus]|uniref:alpha/beta hydrolase family protein n=1 Tax=Caulobacter endophyticus TaxID=2172652 RepID=UPI00240F7E06|nr:S9 family peptidase [Caulobacter endophyticus]MDG2529863.1 S9 family peptidase [Caulobacter endophyticus]
MISRRDVVGGVVLAPALLSARASIAAGTAHSPPSLEELLKPATTRGAALSPDGQQIALLSEREIDGKTYGMVTFVKAADPTATPRTLRVGTMKVQRIAWANNERLLIWAVTDARVAGAPAVGSRMGAIYKAPKVRRVLAINADGSGKDVVLFGASRIKLRENFDLGYVVDMLPDDPRNVLMAIGELTRPTLGLYKVDVYTGEPELVEYGGTSTYGWWVQDGVPVLRYDYNSRGTVLSLHARPPGAKDWTFVRKIRVSELETPDFEILAGTDDPGVLLVASRQDGEETRILRKFDLRTRALGEAVSQRPGRDVENALVDERGRFLAARYTDDRVVYQFADPKLNSHHKAMNAFFNNEANVKLVDASADRERFLAHVSGPRMPGSYFFYDKQAKRFDALGDRQPWLSEARLAPMATLDVTARDGVKLRAYLSTPITPGPHPLVVFPHGGPETRDSLSYDLFAQAFAAQGWLVLQVNFRGSSGYGRAFADAGRRRWGDRMQEDVEDAVAQVLASGKVSPGKVAICGASYGGYAALMGAVRNPTLYKTVVSIAGVSDLPDILAYEREDGEDSPSYRYWVKTIGDPDTDKAALEAASPARRAKAIAAPVLLVHGLLDGVVPARQSRIMAKALRDAGKTVEHVEVRDLPHAPRDEDETRMMLDPVLAYLKTALA